RPAVTPSRNASTGASTQPGSQCSASSSTCGTPGRSASARAKVVFPDPVLPITATFFVRSAGGVDLRLLQLAAVVDVDRLPLGEDVERRLPRLAMAVAGVLRSSEGEMDLGADRAGVDVRDPRLQIAHGPERLVHVTR